MKTKSKETSPESGAQSPQSELPESLLRYPGPSQLVPSKTNPRKSWNRPDWPDFVASVREHGIVQPILVRPVSGDGWPDGVQYEIIAGERRWRAAKETGAALVPVIVQVRTDGEVVELQQIENLQREDLTPLEEAQGYADWHKTLVQSGMSAQAAVDHICARIHRKKTVVYQRLALLKTSPAVQEALKSGTLDLSKATLVAMIPDEGKQAKFLKALDGDSWNGPLSYRQAKELLEGEYQRPLKGAPFDISMEYGKDAMKGGGYAKGCGGCPHRSGNMEAENPELAKNPNTCTNVACFERKKDVAAALAIEQAKKDNKPVLSQKEWNSNSHRYAESDRTCYRDTKNRTFGELAKVAGVEPTLANDERRGLVQVFTPEQLKEIQKKTGVGKRETSRSNEESPKAKAKRLEEEQLQKDRDAAGVIMFDAAVKQLKWTAAAEREFWALVFDLMEYQLEFWQGAADRRGIKGTTPAKVTKDMDAAACRAFFLECVACDYDGFDYQLDDAPLRKVLKLAGLDVKKAEKDALAQIRAKVEETKTTQGTQAKGKDKGKGKRGGK